MSTEPKRSKRKKKQNLFLREWLTDGSVSVWVYLHCSLLPFSMRENAMPHCSDTTIAHMYYLFVGFGFVFFFFVVFFNFFFSLLRVRVPTPNILPQTSTKQEEAIEKKKSPMKNVFPTLSGRIIRFWRSSRLPSLSLSLSLSPSRFSSH